LQSTIFCVIIGNIGFQHEKLKENFAFELENFGHFSVFTFFGNEG